MDTSLFDYQLPPDRIAQEPLSDRSASRLLIHDRTTGQTRHGHFGDLVDLIPPGDLVVVNRSRVLPARLHPVAPPGAAPAEILYIGPTATEGVFVAMVRPGRRFRPGRIHQLADGTEIEVLAVRPDGLRELRARQPVNLIDLLDRLGEMPLPPYITSRASRPEQYQTVFAVERGSVAAPTAGLHFDTTLLERLRQRGVRLASVVLHVGIGTFKPIETDQIEDHPLHAEEYTVDDELADAWCATRAAGGRVWAVGTTSVRALESAIEADGTLRRGTAITRCYLRPGVAFRATDHLITNFHLPRSSLLVLVAAFAGRERVLDLYRQAIEAGYRFYSFGDAMLLI